MIGYFKIDKYIITIETQHYDSVGYEEHNSANYCLCITNNFMIQSIEDIFQKTYNMIKINDIGYIIGDKYEYNLYFYKTKEQAFNKNFIRDKQYLLFKTGYSGLYTEYYNNGNLKYKVYISNGKFEGEYSKYNSGGKIIAKGNYIDGKKHGKFITYIKDLSYYTSLVPEVRINTICDFSNDIPSNYAEYKLDGITVKRKYNFNKFFEYNTNDDDDDDFMKKILHDFLYYFQI
jgi:antitoxin component YwqK of YwqJK toxin-antitoxin module